MPSYLLHCAGEQGLQVMVQSSKHESSSATSHSATWSQRCAILFCLSPFILHYSYNVSHSADFFLYLPHDLLLALYYWNGSTELQKHLLKVNFLTIPEKNAILKVVPHVNLQINIYIFLDHPTGKSAASLGPGLGMLRRNSLVWCGLLITTPSW